MTVPPTSIGNVVVPAGGSTAVQVRGVAPVPAYATGVSARLVAKSTGAGTVSVAPSGAPATPARQVTYRPNLAAHSSATVGLGPDGTITLTNGGAASITVTVVVQGYLQPPSQPGGAYYVPLSPSSLASGVTVAAGATYVFTALPSGTTVADVKGVLLNLMVRSTAAGTASVHPDGGTNPAVPQLDYIVNDYATNEIVVAPGSTGKAAFRNNGTASVTLYLYRAGYYTTKGGYNAASIVAVPPQRVQTDLVVSAGSSVSVQVGGLAGVPANAGGACLHLTAAAGTTSNGSLAYVRYQTGQAATGPMTVRLLSGKYTVANTGTGSVTFSVDVTCYFRNPTVPAPPTGVNASSGDGQATVRWTAPSDDGGAPIIDYTVTTYPGARTVTATTLSATVTGLTNDRSYWFTVRARNAAGESTESAQSLGVTPAPPSPPGTPFVTSVYPRDAAVKVTWSPPDRGAADVTGYRITADPGGASAQAGADKTEAVVGGLANGTTYTFTVVALSAAGDGATSPRSEAVVPSLADVPLEPPALLVVPLNQRVDVQWVAPSDGGAPITGYTVTAEPGGHQVQVAPDTTVTALTGLTNGVAYTVRVVARNKVGASPAAERTGVTPAAARAPAAPTDVRAGARASGVVDVRWNAPVDVGTSAITGYTVVVTPSGGTVSVTGTGATVSGLDPAVAYRFAVRATNAAGTGAASQSSPEVTPRIQVKATPKLLTQAESATLRLVRTDGTLVFEQPPAAIRSLTAGTVLILQAHPLAANGLFRNVTKVTTDSGLVLVATEPAALDQVFDQASLAAVSEVGDADVAEFVAESPQLRRKQPTLRGRTLDQGAPAAGTQGVNIGLRHGHVVVEVNISMNGELRSDPLRPPSQLPPVGGKLEAQIDLNPRLDNDIDVSETGVDTFHHVSVDYVSEFRAKFGFLNQEEFELPGVKIRSRCFTIQVGPVPVVLCLDFSVKPTITVEGSMGVTASVTFGRLVGAEMATHNGEVISHRGINQSNGRQASDVEAYADGDITLALPVVSTLYFYDAAGPGLTVRPYLKLKMDTTQNPWWELRAGVTVGVFFKTRKFFGREIEFSKDNLVDFFVTLASSGSAFKGLKVTPLESSIDPGGSVQLSAQPVLYPPETPISWRKLSGPGSVDGSGNFTANLAGTAVIEAYSPPGPLTGGEELTQRAVVHIQGTTPPDVPGNVDAQPRPLAAQVSWTAPPVTGNLPITRYAVTSTPETRTVYVDAPATSVLVPNLTPGVSYQFRVYAINEAGSSDASKPSPAVVPTEAFRGTGPVVNIAVDAAGNPDNVGQRSGVVISGNGRYVFYDVKTRSNIMPAEGAGPGGRRRIVRTDRFTGETVLASMGLPGYGYGDVWMPVAANYDGSVVAYIGNPYLDYGRGSDELMTYNVNTGVTTAVTGKTINSPEMVIEYPARRQAKLSRDGSIVAFPATPYGASQSRIYYAIGNGEAQPLDRCPLDPGCTTNWDIRFDMTADGSAIYYVTRDSRTEGEYGICYSVMRFDVGGGSGQPMGPSCAPDTGEEISSLAVAGNGSQLAATYAYDPPEIELSVSGLAVKPLPTEARLTPDDVAYRWNVPYGVTTRMMSMDGGAVVVVDQRDWNEPNSSVAVFNTGTREFTTIVAIDDAHEMKDQLWAVAADMSAVAYVLEDKCDPIYCPGNEKVWVQSLY
ncbi:fibronectin type III domain-containing protein [Micromonospora chalcea]|uniref:fibronectin type III domain-containing protein n=2 Tax=Micromonospora chalcea TaxID=1874 RepID=UPI00380E9A5D